MVTSTLERENQTAVCTPSAVESRRTVIPEYHINREEEAVEIRVQLPGVNEESLDINLENQWLRIKGSPDSLDTEGFERIHVEFLTTDYECEFKIPNTVDPEKITAKLDNGLLTLVLTKSEAYAPRNISVNAS